jgi:hypothetical protein
LHSLYIEFIVLFAFPCSPAEETREATTAASTATRGDGSSAATNPRTTGCCSSDAGSHSDGGGRTATTKGAYLDQIDHNGRDE